MQVRLVLTNRKITPQGDQLRQALALLAHFRLSSQGLLRLNTRSFVLSVIDEEERVLRQRHLVGLVEHRDDGVTLALVVLLKQVQWTNINCEITIEYSSHECTFFIAIMTTNESKNVS